MNGYGHNLGDVFRDIAARHPTRPALAWSTASRTTFAELDALSDRVARLLCENDVARGDRVCIRLDKGPLAYAIIVACLKLGAPYFVLDPANPAPRAEHILAKCAPKVVFTAGEAPLEISHGRVFVIDRDRPFDVIASVPRASFEAATDVTGADPAYIMFTSGSTGFPKGAVMSHANVMNFIAWARAEFSVTPDDVFTNVNPLYFDNSVFDIYASLFNGASLVPFDTATMKDPYAALERVSEMRCTVYFSVPSLLIYFQTLKLMTPEAFRQVRTVIFGGEGYPKPKLKELYDCLGDRAELVNVYGPTECTCICSAYRVPASEFDGMDGYPPLGALVPNYSYAILNEGDVAVPPGEIGELCLGGPCVGLGYFNEPALSEKAFRQNPRNASFLERTYRTGDLVRLSPADGKIYFVGRKDSQIKHQGYRIELGEIEHALGRVTGVDEAVVLHSVQGGVSQIIAIVATHAALSAEVLRREAARQLPAYMVPSKLDVVAVLPKNANGKIDRNLLKTRYC